MASIFLPLQLMRRVSQAGKTVTSCPGQLSYSFTTAGFHSFCLSISSERHLMRRLSYTSSIHFLHWPIALSRPIPLSRPITLPRPIILVPLVLTLFALSISSRGEYLPIKVYASDSSVSLRGPWDTMRSVPTHTFDISCEGECLPTKTYAFDLAVIILCRMNSGTPIQQSSSTYVYRHTYTHLQH